MARIARKIFTQHGNISCDVKHRLIAVCAIHLCAGDKVDFAHIRFSRHQARDKRVA